MVSSTGIPKDRCGVDRLARCSSASPSPIWNSLKTTEEPCHTMPMNAPAIQEGSVSDTVVLFS